MFLGTRNENLFSSKLKIRFLLCVGSWPSDLMRGAGQVAAKKMLLEPLDQTGALCVYWSFQKNIQSMLTRSPVVSGGSDNMFCGNL